MIDRIFSNPEYSFWGRVYNGARGLIIAMIYIPLMGAFLIWLDRMNYGSAPSGIPGTHKSFLPYNIFYECISAPLWEETVWRFLPLYLTKTWKTEYKIPIVLASSALFGYMHGDAYNIWLQGVLGLMFACVYIKNGYNLWSPIICHALWNASQLL